MNEKYNITNSSEQEPTLEEEYALERDIYLNIHQQNNISDLKKYAEIQVRKKYMVEHSKNKVMTQLLKESNNLNVKLNAKLICLENKVKQPHPSWFQNLLKMVLNINFF